MRKLYEYLKEKDFFLSLILVVCFFVSVVALIAYDQNNSALLYIGLPFLVGAALLIFTRSSSSEDWKMRYWNISRTSLVIILASSLLLLEGFLCVLFFIPIYFIMIFIAFCFEALWRHFNDRNNTGGKSLVSILPLLILVSSMEGTSEQLSFDTYNEVTVSRIIPLSVEQIHNNLISERSLKSPDKAFMGLFPAPHLFEAKALRTGEVHTLDYIYNRWFLKDINTHQGQMRLQLVRVDDSVIETKVLDDTSYIATYLSMDKTRMEFIPLGVDKTEVRLKVSFERNLHPAWYFQPLQRFGVEAMAESVLEQMAAGE